MCGQKRGIIEDCSRENSVLKQGKRACTSILVQKRAVTGAETVSESLASRKEQKLLTVVR